MILAILYSNDFLYESAAPETGTLNVTTPADLTGTWYRQLDAALQAQGISGLTEDNRPALVSPEASLGVLPAPARRGPAHGSVQLSVTCPFSYVHRQDR